MTEKNTRQAQRMQALEDVAAYERDAQLTEMQLTFCRLMAEGHLTQQGAAEEAGYSPGDSAKVKGCKLMKDPKIQRYVDLLRIANGYTSRITPDDLLRMQLKVYDEAMAAGKHREANTAMDQLMKAHGMYAKPAKSADPKLPDDESKERSEILELLSNIDQREKTQLDN